MNVNNGEVLALGSSPSFDPNIFSKVIRKSDYDRLSSKENGEPLVNRAIQAGYPTGSTFKLITATAALEGGLITPDTVQVDGGSLTVGDVVSRTPATSHTARSPCGGRSRCRATSSSTGSAKRRTARGTDC